MTTRSEIESPALASLTPAERVNIRHSATALERRWKGQMNVETIERFMAESLDIILPNAKLRTFVPVLAERLTNDRLRAIVRLDSDRTDLNPSVLFLCVHNAGRSQMAAGWMRHLAGDQVDVFSGGSEPATELNRAAVAAMAEKGIDISRELPQPWADEIVRAADVIVTMGCGDACPVYPGKRYVDWELDDPAGKLVEEVRPIRDDIEQRVRGPHGGTRGLFRAERVGSVRLRSSRTSTATCPRSRRSWRTRPRSAWTHGTDSFVRRLRPGPWRASQPPEASPGRTAGSARVVTFRVVHRIRAVEVRTTRMPAHCVGCSRSPRKR